MEITTRQFIALLLGAQLPLTTTAAERGYKVEYNGGSVPDLNSGDNLRLVIAQEEVQLMKDKKLVQSIPANAISEISYGQDVHRRVGAAIGIGLVTFGIGALMALVKSKKHFIGVTWDNAGKKGGMAFQAEKGDYRGVLAGLEGISGKKTINTDSLTVKN